jgi:hypothetical protein
MRKESASVFQQLCDLYAVYFTSQLKQAVRLIIKRFHLKRHYRCLRPSTRPRTAGLVSNTVSYGGLTRQNNSERQKRKYPTGDISRDRDSRIREKRSQARAVEKDSNEDRITKEI